MERMIGDPLLGFLMEAAMADRAETATLRKVYDAIQTRLDACRAKRLIPEADLDQWQADLDAERLELERFARPN